jgi:hypothetical protein
MIPGPHSPLGLAERTQRERERERESRREGGREGERAL